MISRQWCGIAKLLEADRYVAHLRTETLPQLAALPGFVAAVILRRAVGEGIEFRIVTTWESIEAIRGFAGEDAERAVVPEKVQALLLSYDRSVAHYEVLE